MTILEKAKQVKNNSEELEKFCRNLFNKGKDWLDLEALMLHAGHKDNGEIYQMYEEWQSEKCDCSGEAGDLHPCPYQEEICANGEPFCNFCESMDI